jgi:transcriptional regulator with XRE-family HTH domain
LPEPPPQGPLGAELEHSVNRSIATRLKEERQVLGLTLQDLADRTQLSLGMISKIENAQTSPSLRTLARLADSLDVPIASFFVGPEAEGEASFVGHGDGTEIARPGTRHGHRYQLLATPGPNRELHPYLVTLTGKSKPFPHFQHEGVEFIHVIVGSFAYAYGAETFEMKAGDSLMFDGRTPHGPRSLAAFPIQFLSITAGSEDALMGLPLASGRTRDSVKRSPAPKRR